MFNGLHIDPADRGVSELERICALPVYDPSQAAPDMTPLFRRPGGFQTLRPIQNRILWLAQHFQGLLALAAVGSGKTLAFLLIPQLVPGHNPLLLIPAANRADLSAQWHEYAKHWNLPRHLNIETYDTLSRPESTDYLRHLAPDVIMLDEADKLRDPKAARTRRFMRYLAQRERAGSPVKLFAMSGSLTTRSVEDYSHLAKYALGTNSPVPLKHGELQTWAKALDVNRSGAPDMKAQGSLSPLIGWAESQAWHIKDIEHDKESSQGPLREAFRKRFVTCPGVVVTDQQSIDIPIYMRRRDVAIPEIVQGWLDYLDRTWRAPNGDELEDGLAFDRVSRQLAQGLYYEWVWGPSGPDTEWLEKRAGWHRCLRMHLPHSKEGWDSPFLCSQMAERNPYVLPSDLLHAWNEWKTVKDRPEPPSRAVWLSDFLCHDAIAWARQQNEPSIIWYEHPCVGERINALSGFDYVGTGPDADHFLATLPTARTITASAKAHSRGKNLQKWHNQLVLSPSSNGSWWEQLLGRMHRAGQTHPHVQCFYYSHTPKLSDAVNYAVKDARYTQSTTGSPQKLTHAVWLHY